MGLFSSIIGGVSSIFSSKSKAKQADAERKAEAERTLQAQIQAKAAADLEASKIKNLEAQAKLNNSKMMSYLPYAGGGLVGLGLLAFIFKKK